MNIIDISLAFVMINIKQRIDYIIIPNWDKKRRDIDLLQSALFIKFFNCLLPWSVLIWTHEHFCHVLGAASYSCCTICYHITLLTISLL